jgi:hypothetical protein
MGRSMAASDTFAGQHDLAGTLTFRERFSSAPATAFLADCWMVACEDVLPIRQTAAFKGQYNFVGLWWCAPNHRHVGFEFWCERDRLMSLDFDPDVIGVSSRPFSITLPPSLPQHFHVPDYFFRRRARRPAGRPRDTSRPGRFPGNQGPVRPRRLELPSTRSAASGPSGESAVARWLPSSTVFARSHGDVVDGRPLERPGIDT